MSFQGPEVTILQKLDVSDNTWCNEAVLFSVKKGRGTLTHVTSEESEDYDYLSQLLLNGKPVIQGQYPICPTCTGMLATGYGTENIECPELNAVRDCMNSDYTDIVTSSDIIKPLLGLLDDGIYVLADVPHSPTNGEDCFFYSVPNKLTYNSAACDEYYNHEFYSSTEGFPKYLYPTQSSKLCNLQRVNEYIKILKESKTPPRGLAYYEKGFISALLDGHHKACAAAVLGIKLNCLTIIRVDGFTIKEGCNYQKQNTMIQSVLYSGIKVPAKPGETIEDYSSDYIDRRCVELSLSDYHLTDEKFPESELNIKTKYINVKQLSGMYALEIESDEITYRMIDKMIHTNETNTAVKLGYILNYLMETDQEKAYYTAKQIIENNSYILPVEDALKVLCQFKNEETEQLMINYIVNHTVKDKCWDIANSYWG